MWREGKGEVWSSAKRSGKLVWHQSPPTASLKQLHPSTTSIRHRRTSRPHPSIHQRTHPSIRRSIHSSRTSIRRRCYIHPSPAHSPATKHASIQLTSQPSRPSIQHTANPFTKHQRQNASCRNRSRSGDRRPSVQGRQGLRRHEHQAHFS